MKTFFRQFANGDIFPWERAFTRETLNIALPIVIQTAFMASMHIIDNIMIGQLGELELASVTQANRVTFLFQLVIFGLVSGTSTLVAQFWGKRDVKGIHAVLGIAICLSLVGALLFIVPAQLIPQAIMGLLLTDQAAIQTAAGYLGIVSIGYLGTALSQCFATVQKSTEQARLPMFAEIIGLATNTVLNYCLIFGRFGFPRMGVRGGALATVIAIFVTLFIVIIMGYRLRLATAAPIKSLIPRSWPFARRYLSVALPVIFNEGLWSLAMVMYSVVYGRMGTATVAAVSIFNTVEQVALATTRGLTNACAVMVGKRIGAGEERNAYHVAKRMLYMAIPVSAVAGILLMFLSGPLVSLFNVTPSVAANARTLIRIAAVMIWAVQLGSLLVVGILRSGGDVRMSLYLDAGTAWLIGVPIVALSGLALGLDIRYVFILSYVEAIIKIGLGLLRFRSGKWIHNLVRDSVV